MIRLFRSEFPQMWIAYVPQDGWVMFPAAENGWEQRQPAHGLDPLHMREVPISVAANTGIKPFGSSPQRHFAKVA